MKLINFLLISTLLPTNTFSPTERDFLIFALPNTFRLFLIFISLKEDSPFTNKDELIIVLPLTNKVLLKLVFPFTLNESLNDKSLNTKAHLESLKRRHGGN